MREHHKRAIENLVEVVRDSDEFLAFIVSGSLSRGMEREYSDLDVYMVATDESYNERIKTYDLFYKNTEVCDYPDGYVDGKIINYNFVKQAVEHASEPTRVSFEGGMVPYSEIPDLEELVKKIPVYPEHQRLDKMRSFYAQTDLWGDYMARQGLTKDNPYLTYKSVTSLVFFACRYVLAKNRILFPCHKTMFDYVRRCRIMPENFVERSLALLGSTDYEEISAYLQMFRDFADEGVLTHAQCVALFIIDNEWNWMDGAPPLEDC